MRINSSQSTAGSPWVSGREVHTRGCIFMGPCKPACFMVLGSPAVQAIWKGRMRWQRATCSHPGRKEFSNSTKSKIHVLKITTDAKSGYGGGDGWNFFPPHLESHNHQTWVSGILSFFTLLQDSLLAEMLGTRISLPFFHSIFFLQLHLQPAPK